jgi:hypothetical protein
MFVRYWVVTIFGGGNLSLKIYKHEKRPLYRRLISPKVVRKELN